MKLNPILFLFFTTLFTKSTSSKNDKYDTCSKKFSCGDLDDLGYPFYDGSTRPDYCGYPGFNLSCGEDVPQITINRTNYSVSDINSDNYVVSVYRKDKWTDFCPDSLFNTTIDYSKFNFTPSDQNITFFFDCGDINNNLLSGLSLQTSCDLGGVGSQIGYYLTPAMVDEYKALNLFATCKANLFLPISDDIDSEPSLVKLRKAFFDGFELGLMVESGACSTCEQSDGECGYNWELKKFVCHCADADYDDKCKVGSPDQANRKMKTPLIIGVSVGVVALLALLAGCFLFQRRRRSQLVAPQKTRGIHPSISNGEGGLGGYIGSNGLTSSQGYTTTPSSTLSQTTPSYTSSVSDIARDKTCYFGVHVFDYTELEHATCNFDDSKELGDGGFGTVYYGVLPDGRQVAVKRLYENSFKRVEQFMNEIRILAELHHKNLVALYGCTSRRSRELLLVYEYISNGTVADHIHGKLADTTFVPWHTRLSIAIETAEALAFLHRNDVIHRDVKTTNILLDNQFHVKVADFGLSRLFPTDMTHVSTAPQGTPGYVDPDYYICYKLTEKSDVYSFGVVLIELISSKHAVDITRHRHHVNLANMALDWIQSQEIHKLVDPRLGFDNDESIKAMVNMVGELGFRCLQQDRDMRPTMDEVMASLRAIQLEGLKAQKQEVVDIIVYGDDVGLLTNPTPPLSPELPRSNDVV